MSVKTVFIDVDLTLVDENSELRKGVFEALVGLRDYGYELYAWSMGGRERAEHVLCLHDLRRFFKGAMGKPDIIIDDSPAEHLTSPVRVNWIDVGKPGAWRRIWSLIFCKDISFARD